MFELTPEPFFKKRLTISTASAVEPDVYIEQDLVISWKYLQEDERQAFIERFNEGIQSDRKSAEAYGKALTEAQKEGRNTRKKLPVRVFDDKWICRELIVDIEGLLVNGEPLAFKPDLIDQLYRRAEAATALAEVIPDILSGKAQLQALEKN